MGVSKKQVTDDQLLSVFREIDEPLTTPEVADHFDITRQAVGKRLETLADEGKLDRRATNHTIIYWLPRSVP